MRVEVLQWLQCPETNEPLELAPGAETASDGHVMRGTLSTKGGKRYDIVDGVPVLIPGSTTSLEKETADRFAEEWHRWSELRDYYEKQFLDWVAPVSKEDFKDKVVFEGGCGEGRHTHVVANMGVKAIVSVDLGTSAYVAFRNTRHLTNAHVVIGDLLQPPVQRVFDLAFSVGVLHHLPDPRAGFLSLSSKVKPGGRVVFWVYGHENNEWITRFVDPVRKQLTARLDSNVLRALSAVPTAGLFGLIKVAYDKKRNPFVASLPYGEYFASMHDFPFDELHSIVFDQLVTPVAYYLRGDEVRAWFEGKPFKDVEVRWHRKYSWTGTAQIPS